ncbi:unnamed protein product [Cuscuta campestris]|uniref:Response regulatory domain-containing protein n=1 Tax=Cuscuta campestris TaxID=132261 RepID=A0A484NAG9_9ASTE|nr:unnamed protein product [Cuscuta campestris]
MGSRNNEDDVVVVGEGLSALVVDDDPVAQMIHKVLLDRYGLRTQVAKNGEEAVVLCRSGARFDLVLMDKEMPVMDGVLATRELREMGVKSTIVGVTSHGPEADMGAFMGAGLNDCFAKPLTPEIVYRIVNLLVI